MERKKRKCKWAKYLIKNGKKKKNKINLFSLEKKKKTVGKGLGKATWH
jgi:hypothetical protein